MRRNKSVGEFEFDIRTIVKQMFWSWKLFVVFMLMGAISLPLLMSSRDAGVVIQDKNQIILSEDEKMQIERYYLAEELFEKEKKYIEENQLILGIEPSDANAYVLRYLITEEDEDNEITNIKNIYYSNLFEKRDIRIDGELKQTVSITKEWRNVLVVDYTRYNGKELFFKIYNCEGNLDAEEYKLKIEEMANSINELGLIHDLVLVEEGFSTDYDYHLVEFKDQIYIEYRYYLDRLNNVTGELSPNAQQYIQLEEDDVIVISQESFGKKDALIYGCIGAVAGFLLVAMYVVLKYICSKTPNTSFDVESIFGLAFIGKFEDGQKKKTDLLVDKVLVDKESKFSDKEWMQYALDNVIDYKSMKNIAIVDFEDLESVSESVLTLCGELSSEVEFTKLEGLENTIDSKKKLQTYDGVVFILKKKTTPYKKIDEMISLCEDSSIEVLGYIIVD